VEVAPRFLGSGSFLARRDPRVLILVPVAAIVIAAQIRDVRIMAAFVVVAFAYYAAARIPFRQVALNWAFVAVFIGVFALINGFIVGADRTAGGESGELLFTVPVIGLPVTLASLSYAANVLLRFIGIAAVGFPMAFSIRPGDLSVAFARLGVPARFAYGLDLTFKFLPTTAATLRETIAAQRLRGYERGGSRNPLQRLRQTVPLMVPVTVGSFVEAEDTVDALDLRGFGTVKRTWLRRLRFGPVDIALVAVAVAAVLAATVLSISGTMPPLWIP
jgi:energy-coupling factor transport system permease protein